MPRIPSERINPFEPCPTITTWFQTLFTPLSGCFSVSPHGTAFTIGLRSYLGLGVDDSRLPTQIPMHGTQDSQSDTFRVTPTRLSPSMASLSRELRLLQLGGDRVLQHHIPSQLPDRVRFALCPFRSPLLRASLLLSLPPDTKMLQSSGFPLANANDAILSHREVSFGNSGLKGCMRLTRTYRSLPRPSSAPEPNHSPSGLHIDS